MSLQPPCVRIIMIIQGLPTCDTVIASSVTKGAAMQIEMVVAESFVEGSKNIFNAQRVTETARASLDDVSQSLRSFCEGLQASFAEMATAMGHLSLNEIELSVELTAKGEVRLIAAASAETKGSIKLKFTRNG
jgi:hypothetical protein